MNKLFNFILSEYQRLYPQPKISEIFRKTPKKQRILTVLFFLFPVLVVVSSLLSYPWLTIIFTVTLAAVGIILIRLIRKNHYPIAFPCQNEHLNPLRNTLQTHHLYNPATIDFLIEKCESKAKEETNLEKYIRSSKTLLSLLLKCLGIIVAFSITTQLGIIDIQQFDPTINGLLFLVISFFVLDYQLGILVTIAMIVVVLTFSMAQYVLSSIFDELNNRRRKKIYALVDDLKFIRMDFIATEGNELPVSKQTAVL